jgi:hypothetical protein
MIGPETNGGTIMAKQTNIPHIVGMRIGLESDGDPRVAAGRIVKAHAAMKIGSVTDGHAVWGDGKRNFANRNEDRR